MWCCYWTDVCVCDCQNKTTVTPPTITFTEPANEPFSPAVDPMENLFMVELHVFLQCYTTGCAKKSDTLVNYVNIMSYKLEKNTRYLFTLFEQFQHSLQLIHRVMCSMCLLFEVVISAKWTKWMAEIMHSFDVCLSVCVSVCVCAAAGHWS